MHGSVTGLLKEFELNYPDEYITSVQGTYSNVARDNTTIVKTLTFKTSQGRTSPMFGNTAIFSTDFVVEGKAGAKLIGFHGRSGSALDAIGAHFFPSSPTPVLTLVPTKLPMLTAPVPAPVPTPVPTILPMPVAPVPALVPAKKLEAQGGYEGAAWDDGFYEDVRKIYVGQGYSAVSFIKFEYDIGKKLVAGDGHGKKSHLGTEEFELDFPNEHIVSVEGCYENVFETEAEVVTMIKFKTNKRTSPPYGHDGGTKFVLEMKDHKIVGFHGKARDYVHQIGVHVLPISKS